MTLTDAAGLLGVLMVLIAYAGAALGKLNPQGGLSLSANLAGSVLILFSLLTESFNLSATTMEGAWAVVSMVGLGRLAWTRWKAR